MNWDLATQWILVVQVLTFVMLGIYFLSKGNWTLGTAQLCYAVASAVLFGGGVKA